MRKGEILRLVDLEGQQAIDFLCFSADDLADRYNAANTIKLNRNIYLGKGSELWSVRARKMMTIIEDTCGSHDTLYGCCSVEVDDIRFGGLIPGVLAGRLVKIRLAYRWAWYWVRIPARALLWVRIPARELA